jgi:Ser/Thr protein kinase RdoA (MazF antagonist)
VRVLNTIQDTLSTVSPIKNDGSFVLEHSERIASFFKKESGLIWHETSLTNQTHFNAGKALGLLHKAFQNMNKVDRPVYSEHRDIKLVKDSKPFYEKKANELLDTIASWRKDPNEYGLIHGDYLFGNLLYDGEEVIVMEFDDMEYGYYFYDIAVYLFYLLLGGNPSNIHKDPNIEVFKHFIKGYRSVNHTTILDFDILNALFRLRQLKLLGTITKTMDPSKLGPWQKAYIEKGEV